MNEYLLIGLKTVLFFTIILLIIRLMGKRELGQLNVFDIIIFFMISEIFSNAIADPQTSVFLALLPIFIIFVLQLLMSVIVLKSRKIRTFIESKPSIIIDNGIVNYDEMKRQRYNINDLLQQIREDGVDSINDIKYAVLESNGGLSVIKKDQASLAHPFPLISDGEVDVEVLKTLNISHSWIEKELNKQSIYDIKEVFIAFLSTDNTLVLFSKKLNNIIKHKNN